MRRKTAKSVLDAWTKNYVTRVHAFELQDYRGRSVATFNCAHASGCQL